MPEHTPHIPSKFSLAKQDRLKSKKIIDSLFVDGSSQFTYPIKLSYKWLPLENNDYLPLLFSVTVPKKKIRLAVNRNKIKRRIREAYRLHKFQIQESVTNGQNQQLVLMFIYITNEIVPYKVIEKSVSHILKKLANEVTD